MSILQEIISHKWGEVERHSAKVPVDTLKDRNSPIRDFANALVGDEISIIAEIKRKSPSQGSINPSMDIVEIAESYEKAGAKALSVLTDEKYFGGSLDFLREIREAVDIPVLRKDFIISEYQVWESYNAGADAILLILDGLELETAENLYALASELGIHVLVETHSAESLECIHALNPEIIGINARNLDTMEIEFQRMLNLYEDLPGNAIAVAESGITEPEHLHRVAKTGYDAALIGTAFMKTDDPGKTLRTYLEQSRQETAP
ncbi:MAG: indole-3-glycerol phosphate synthase TrpC [Candidatus Marinimicrobia bacterium]|nr:indole-3-glycerol phosphate synthase TrpC [Candidatus Neomarinimicrobiota bacterium]MCF7828241.1 indole-3-glycerol phosphate synthase TrpC [Candidatus Neomarinimicrobiota bacterium]MCF7879584.1 indole-3-glycerol phosphate synthase TrpC [Candidatus Neomarinimicrobiota bacterium]